MANVAHFASYIHLIWCCLYYPCTSWGCLFVAVQAGSYIRTRIFFHSRSIIKDFIGKVQNQKTYIPNHHQLHTLPYRWCDSHQSWTSDILRAFVALVWPKIDLFHQTVRTINVHDHERARVIATQLQILGLKLACGYTASKCLSRYLLMKRSRLYCQTVTWLYCETVSQSSHVTARHSRSYCPTHFWYVLFPCFTFLCLTGCSLADAARLLFIIGYRDGHLLAV